MKVPWGLQSSTKSMVHVDSVPNGKASGSECPSCGGALVAKNRGVRKAHHFAHDATTDYPGGACEGWLHATAKRLLYERIQGALANSKPLTIRWRCSRCSCLHQGDLLKNVTGSCLEKHIPSANIRPDISLLGGVRVVKLVEIVVSHSPDQPVHQYSEDNSIPLVELNVDGAEGWDTTIRAATPDVTIHHFSGCPCDCITCREPTCGNQGTTGCASCWRRKMRQDIHGLYEYGHFAPTTPLNRFDPDTCSCEKGLRNKWLRARGSEAKQFYLELVPWLVSQ